MKQPEALRLADALEWDAKQGLIFTPEHTDEIVAELRRLHSLNQELLGALKAFSDYVHHEQSSTDGEVTYSTTSINHWAFLARAAIAKGREGMKTDRELLELAAKAAGLDIWAHPDDQEVFFTAPPLREWNPLTDDGDALRLAVKLKMEIAIFADQCHTRCIEHGQHSWFVEIGDPPVVTRRAIVCAAAAIGEQTK